MRLSNKFFRLFGLVLTLFSVEVNAGDAAQDALTLAFEEQSLSNQFWEQDIWRLAGSVAITVTLAERSMDSEVREHFTEEPTQPNLFSTVGNGWGSLRYGSGIMLGLYGYGRLSDNPVVMETSVNMLEAAMFSGALTQALKYGMGRVRPNETDSPENWFGDGLSFPSGHVTFAFAVSTAFAESVDHPSLLRRGFAYSLAGLTAYARMYDNKHWLSDVIAGAAIGASAALFVVNKNAIEMPPVSVIPLTDGAQITYTFKLPY